MRYVFLACLLLLPVVSGVNGDMRYYERGEQVLEIELHPDLSEKQSEDALAWVKSTADALANVYGRWPRV